MMNEDQMRAEISRLLEAAEHSKPWYGSGEKLARTTPGTALFEAIEALISKDLEEAAQDRRTDVPTS